MKSHALDLELKLYPESVWRLMEKSGEQTRFIRYCDDAEWEGVPVISVVLCLTGECRHR